MNWTKRSDKGYRKEWRAVRGRYRIIWRDRVFGVSVAPGYQCCARNFLAELDRPIWELIDRKRPLYRTLNAAKLVCEKHSDPDFRPPKKKGRKGKVPTKPCPDCGGKLHTRKRICECGHKFPQGKKTIQKARERALKKKKPTRKTPLKTCTDCGNKIHVRKMTCSCGFKFIKKGKK